MTEMILPMMSAIDTASSAIAGPGAPYTPAMLAGELSPMFYLLPVVVILSTGVSFLIAGRLVYGLYKGWMQNSNLLQNGEPASARILEIWDTGVSINDNPQIRMLLEVHADGRAPYQTETKSIVSRIKVPQVQPGSRVQVRFDRQDPLKVAVVV